MALAIPALLLILFGIIEFGSAWRSYQVVTNAAREGARRAVMASGAGLVDASEAGVLGVVEGVMTSGGLDYEPGYVTLTCGGAAGLCQGPASRGLPEAVQIDYPYQFVVLGSLMQLACGGGCGDVGTITLTTSSVMRSEG